MADRTPSARAQIITRRTYNRPKDDGTFETWAETVGRVAGHQRRLWERAQGGPLTPPQEAELDALRDLMLSRRSLPAGRTLWLGGTELAWRREASQFNCAHLVVRTVHDVVDAFWLLLQGCGTGFTPHPGALCGFTRRMDVRVVRSSRAGAGGRQENRESYDPKTREWVVSVGDSAEAWARAVGKLLAGKFPARSVVFDLSEIRPAGSRLKGYGWICSGDANLATALAAIAGILNRRAGKLLTKIDVLDVVNWLGTVLSSRRSAQIALVEYGSDEWRAFAEAKSGEWWRDNPQRAQSNNSLVFNEHPGRRAILSTLEAMHATGGGDPGIINAAEARRRAPWLAGVNPCAEILLGDKGFCNLCTTDLTRFRDDHTGLVEAVRLVSRANYRQTVVNLRDGVLQDAWHQQNEYLRLCGVSLTGYAGRPDLTSYDLRQLRQAATAGAFSMADELGLERPKNVTTGKPEGTLAKVMDAPEGCHRPLGRFVLNNVSFSRHDPMVAVLESAGYRAFDHPTDPASRVVALPVEWSGVPFDPDGLNRESAVSQLDRYRSIMRSYCDQNQSVTVSYDESELPAVADWLDRHWDDYVGVSFLRRADPAKTAADLGYPYLPQEVVSEAAFRAYAAGLRPVDFDAPESAAELAVDAGLDCPGGACPVK